MEHLKTVCLFAVVVAVVVRCDVTGQNQTASGVLKNIMTRMDSIIRPNLDVGPVEIKCGFYVVSFGSISEVDMDYSMDIYMRQTWEDERMAFSSDNITMITLSGKAIEHIWTPDLFFPNEKSAHFHVVTVPNKLMKVYSNGTVIYSVRITLKLSCPMDLTHFPMDNQECFIKIESYSYSISELTLQWYEEDPIEIDVDLELPQFDLKGYDVLKCSMAYKTGEYPCLKARFRLERQYGFFMLQTYVPSILIVILSWVSFWINMEAVPARISLGVTTVLTMATQMSGSKSAIPRVSYPKAIDVWLSTCMFFVFASLLEYAIVNALSRKHTKLVKRRETMRKRSGKSHMPEEPELEMDGSRPLMKQPRQWLKSTEKARILDKASRVLFPISFIVFNIVYWVVYLNPVLTD